MTLAVLPEKLHGNVTPPPSKSQAHRVLIAAALADGKSQIYALSPSEDISATRRCLEELGAEVREEAYGWTVNGMAAGPMSPLRRLALPRMDCGESGSTLRFLIPIALAVRGGGSFTGHGKLMQRPQTPYISLFQEKHIFWEQKDSVFTVQGQLTPGEYRIPGDVSSQFVTGLLYALPLLTGDSNIILTTALESAGYVELTRQTLQTFGITSRWTDTRTLTVPGEQKYQTADTAIERDWSQAAFWYAAESLGHTVHVQGMNAASLQTDRQIVDWLRTLADRPAGGTVTLDVSMHPDIVPPLAAVGALGNGTLILEKAGRLRLKESDRLAAIREELCKLGADVTEEADRLILRGVTTLHGAVVDAHNDHRIAMMLAIAATRADGPVILTGAECVRKSYPDFWTEYARLGGTVIQKDETILS